MFTQNDNASSSAASALSNIIVPNITLASSIPPLNSSATPPTTTPATKAGKTPTPAQTEANFRKIFGLSSDSLNTNAGLNVFAYHAEQKYTSDAYNFGFQKHIISIDKTTIKKEARVHVVNAIVANIQADTQFVNLFTEINLGYSSADVDTGDALIRLIDETILPDGRKLKSVNKTNENELNTILTENHIAIKLFYRGSGGSCSFDALKKDDAELLPLDRKSALQKSYCGIDEVQLQKLFMQRRKSLSSTPPIMSRTNSASSEPDELNRMQRSVSASSTENFSHLPPLNNMRSHSIDNSSLLASPQPAHMNFPSPETLKSSPDSYLATSLFSIDATQITLPASGFLSTRLQTSHSPEHIFSTTQRKVSNLDLVTEGTERPTETPSPPALSPDSVIADEAASSSNFSVALHSLPMTSIAGLQRLSFFETISFLHTAENKSPAEVNVTFHYEDGLPFTIKQC
ncbi:MAG: hypothetical protein P4M12_09165 [Gammaproteobacteria bacterium]|nr:hypothetical protein [Gammaproteobacteria bacterium]